MEIMEMTLRLTDPAEIRRVMAAVDGFDLTELDQLQKERNEPEPVLAASKRKKLDRGKMMALHRAGWSAVKIVDEMHCSTTAVYNVVNETKEDNSNEN